MYIYIYIYIYIHTTYIDTVASICFRKKQARLEIACSINIFKQTPKIRRKAPNILKINSWTPWFPACGRLEVTPRGSTFPWDWPSWCQQVRKGLSWSPNPVASIYVNFHYLKCLTCETAKHSLFQLIFPNMLVVWCFH